MSPDTTFIIRYTVNGEYVCEAPKGAKFVAEHEVNGETVELYVQEPSYKEGYESGFHVGFEEGYEKGQAVLIRQIKQVLLEEIVGPRTLLNPSDQLYYNYYNMGYKKLSERILDVLAKFEEPKKNDV
jgi:hypothetical protein